MEDLLQHVLGPMGGVFGLGFAAGYMFCTRTLLNESKARIDNLEREMKEMRSYYNEEINMLRNKYENVITNTHPHLANLDRNINA